MKFLGKTKVFAIIFYVIAALYCLYTIFTVVSTIQYLMSVVDSGMYVSITASDMIQAFVGQVGPNLVYTLVLFFCGYAIDLISGNIIPATEKEETVTPVVTEVKEDSPVTLESSDVFGDNDSEKTEETTDDDSTEMNITPSEIEETIAEALSGVHNTEIIDDVELENEEK